MLNNLINAWIIYDKGMIPDGGTGENQRPATDEEIQEAGLQIEEFITTYKITPLNSEVEKAINSLKVFALYKNNISVASKENERKINEVSETIKQALKDKDNKFDLCLKVSLSRKREIGKLKSKLNVIEDVVNQNPINTISKLLAYENIKKISRDFNNE